MNSQLNHKSTPSRKSQTSFILTLVFREAILLHHAWDNCSNRISVRLVKFEVYSVNNLMNPSIILLQSNVTSPQVMMFTSWLKTGVNFIILEKFPMVTDQEFDGHQFWHLYSINCKRLFHNLKLVRVMFLPHISLGLLIIQFGQISDTRQFS